MNEISSKTRTPDPRRIALKVMAAVFLLLVVGTALLPWRSLPADEIAVAVVAPIVSLFVVYIGTVYLIYYSMYFAFVRLVWKGFEFPMKGDAYQIPLKVTPLVAGIANAVLPMLVLIAALVSLGLYSASDVEWAVPIMKLVTVALSLVTLGAFFYGWIRGIWVRSEVRQAQVSILLLRISRIVGFLGRGGVARG